MGVKLDWRYLRPALIALGISVALSVALIYTGVDYRAKMAAALDQQNARRNAVEMRFRTAEDDRRDIDLYLERFKEIKAAGMLDAEQRMDWVDALRAASQAMKLPLARYQISPQAPFTAPYLQELGDIAVNVSRVKLEMGLVHEGDMLRLLDALEQRVQGQFHVQGCIMQRAAAEFGYYADHPNISATCYLRWFTLQPAAAAAETAL